jgi:hypothetical protein
MTNNKAPSFAIGFVALALSATSSLRANEDLPRAAQGAVGGDPSRCREPVRATLTAYLGGPATSSCR